MLTLEDSLPKRIYNPIMAMGFSETLRGKYCWYPIAVMGVVDTFGHYLLDFCNYLLVAVILLLRIIGSYFGEFLL